MAVEARGQPTDEEIQAHIEELAEEREDLLGDIARRYLARQEGSS